MLLAFVPSFVMAQWTAKQSIGNTNLRTFATSFSLNGFIYVVGGQLGSGALSDVWAYNIQNDTWSQKTNFPGAARGGAVAFTIGNKAYFMCGSTYNGQFLDDVWEYNGTNDSWIQKGSFPGGPREEAVGFVIGNKGYLGTGYVEIYGPNSTTSATYDDFWEYDPATDTWTAKANVPGQPRGWAVGASAAGKGYIGLGGNSNQNQSYSDFWEYDLINDNWTAVSSYPLAVSDAMCFSIAGEVYLCGGINFSNFAGTSSFRKYSATTNSWTNLTAMGGGITMGAVASVYQNRAFVGTGYDAGLNERSDWWEYTSACTNPIAFNTSTVATNGNAQCSGQIVVSAITNGCGPYTVSITPVSGTVVTLSGAGNTFTITNLCAGNYTVTVHDNGCCGPQSKICKVVATLTNGIPDYTMDGLTIFPNPGSGIFKIKGESEILMEASDIHIKDMLGGEIEFELHRNVDAMELELSTKEKGIYFLSVRNEKIQTLTKLIVE